MAAEGFDLATRQLRIEYRQPALPGDELAISTWLSELAEEGAVRHTTVARASDGELLAQGHAAWGCVDVKTRAAMALPAAFVDAQIL
jgi:acyl-CoA thioesterase FadM